MHLESVLLKSKSLELMNTMRLAILKEFPATWIYVHGNEDDPDTEYQLEIGGNGGGVMLDKEKFNKIKFFIDQYMLENDNVDTLTNVPKIEEEIEEVTDPKLLS